MLTSLRVRYWTSLTSLFSGRIDIMQKHAMALGYFFLAVFCLFASTQGYLQLYVRPLWLAAMVAVLMGLAFLWSACAPQLAAVWQRLGEIVRLAQEPPAKNSRRAAETPSAT